MARGLGLRKLALCIGVAVAATGGAGCGPGDAPAGRGEAWPAADVLFQIDTRFLGADGAYTVDLGGDRVLWLFGDTLVARDETRNYRTSAFLRNTVAIQTGRDPSRAFMRFYWRHDDDGAPQSWLPEEPGGHWYWPGQGIRIGQTLVLFYGRLRQDGAPGPSSFADEGWTAHVIDNPDAEPSAWRPRLALLPPDTSGSTSLGEAVVRDPDPGSDHVYVYGTHGAHHAVFVARFSAAAMQAGDLSHPAYYCGGTWAEGCTPSDLIDIGYPELSVHHDARLGLYLMVASTGYGSTGLGWRSAPRPEGPWSRIRDVYRPVESFRDGSFNYAGKAHPELTGPGGGLVVTYVPSAFESQPPALDATLYHPHFVRVFTE